MGRIAELIRNFPDEGKIWAIALRKRCDKMLFDGNDNDFTFIPNSFRYWRADPFLFDYEGETYLFAELFDRIKGKGVIGVARIKNNKCQRFKICLELGEHLSYPCVYRDNNKILMIPECSKSGKITIYNCVSFPDKWEKYLDIFDGAGVDTTPCSIIANCEDYYLSTLRINGSKANDNLYLLSKDGSEAINLIENDFCSRPAGHCFIYDNKIYRPAQNCTTDYGSNIVFNTIEKLGKDGIIEKTVVRVYPADSVKHNDGITVSVNGTSISKFEGLHTYNFSENYEVIDLAYHVGRSAQYLLRKLIKRLKKGKIL